MNTAQYILLACLALLWLWRADRYAMACLTANFVVTLAICLAMDLGALDRAGSTSWQMVVDLGTAAGMVLRPGLSRILAMGYAVTLPVYAAILFFALPQVEGFGVITLIAFVQLGVVTIDTFTGGGVGGGKRGRNRILGYCLAKSHGSANLAQRAVAGDTQAGFGGLDDR